MNRPEDLLCRQCGLCCDGSLFENVLLSETELAPIESVIGYEKNEHGTFLQQPCRAFCNQQCQVYSTRPRGCQSYEWEPLKELRAGEISAERALEQIRDVKGTIEAIHALLIQLSDDAPELPLSFRCESALSQAWDLTAPQSVQENQERLYQRVTELDRLLQNRFRTSLSS